MAQYESFEDMPVWQEAMELAVGIHSLTAALPRSEDYGLTSQIRRSSLSVAGNIAEGFGRFHYGDKARFYYNARGSLCETRSHLVYGVRVGYFTEADVRSHSTVADSIGRELNTLIRSIKNSRTP